MRQNLLWNKPPHRTNDRISDVPGVGRYHVRRSAPRVAQWDVRLNGMLLAQVNSAEEAIGFAERDCYQRAREFKFGE